MVALTDILGSEEKAIEYAGKVLRISGRVLPVTIENANLVARYHDGTVVCGETHIDEPEFSYDDEKNIHEVFLDPRVSATEKTLKAIHNADLILLGPGDLYTSIIPNLLAHGVRDAVSTTKAKVVYVVNLMTKFGQTTGFSAGDHVAEITKYAGKRPDHVIVHSSTFSPDILALYEQEREFPVVDDLQDGLGYMIVRDNIASGESVEKRSGDALKRSLVRHDSDKLASIIVSLLD